MNLAHHNSGILIPRAEYEELTEAMATVLRIGSRFTPSLIERLDRSDGDPDLEDNNDREATDGDDRDIAWVEWHTMRRIQKRGPNFAQFNEDDEDDDPSGQYDEDYYTGPAKAGEGAGCPISDPGEYEDGY